MIPVCRVHLGNSHDPDNIAVVPVGEECFLCHDLSEHQRRKCRSEHHHVFSIMYGEDGENILVTCPFTREQFIKHHEEVREAGRMTTVDFSSLNPDVEPFDTQSLKEHS